LELHTFSSKTVCWLAHFDDNLLSSDYLDKNLNPSESTNHVSDVG